MRKRLTVYSRDIVDEKSNAQADGKRSEGLLGGCYKDVGEVGRKTSNNRCASYAVITESNTVGIRSTVSKLKTCLKNKFYLKFLKFSTI